MKRQRPLTRRNLGFERLESRALLTAEGQAYAFDQTLDVSDLYGTVTGAIAWGDGTASSATIQNPPATGSIRFRFDYSLDTTGFFSDASRRVLLQTAADMVSSKFSDALGAIQPQAGDTWEARFLDPITGLRVTRTNLTIAANELLVFVGARNLGAAEGGVADRGGFSAQSPRPAFLSAVQSRGQAGALASPATDVGPWGGSIAFDSAKGWYFGWNSGNLKSNQLDFVSVATHELMHVMGFGTTPVWDSKVVNSLFVGANAVAVFGAAVPMADGDHFSNSVTIDARRPAMVQIFQTGERLLPSRLDLAGLKDIGWELIPQTVRVTGSHTYGDNADLSVRVTLVGASLGSKSTTSAVSITNAPPVLASISNKTAQAGVPFVQPGLGQFTDSGFGMPLATPSRSETFTYRIQWGDGSPDQSGPAIISSLGSPGQATVGFFDALHTYQSSGTFTTTVRVSDDDGGFADRSFQVTVAQSGRVSLSLDKSAVSENAGPGAAVLTVTRSGTSLTNPLLVTLTSSDTSEATVPAIATIPANQASTTVSITAVDDALFDGTQRVNFNPGALGVELVGVSLDVTDFQPLILTATRSELQEGVDGESSTVATVSIRSPAPAGGVLVNLAANPAGVLVFPASVLIPAGSTQASWTVSVFNDDRPSNPRTVVLSSSGPGVIPGTLNLLVRDDDPARWTNPINPYDIDQSGALNPLDVLLLIDEINRSRSRVLDPISDAGLLFVDPNRDGALDPLDVLFVIDQINRR
jgi:hypothetical protein